MLTLHSDYIFWFLSQKHTVFKNSLSFPSTSFSYPALFSADCALKPGLLYLSSLEETNLSSLHLSEDTLLLLTTASSFSPCTIAPGIWIVSFCSLAQLFEEIQEVFFQMQQWNSRLLSCQHQKNSIQTMLDFSLEIFPHSLLILSSDFQILAGAVSDPLPSTPSGFCNPEELMAVKNLHKYDPVYSKSWENEHSFFSSSDEDSFSCVCVNLKPSDHSRCRLILANARANETKIFGPLLEHLAGFLQDELKAGSLSPVRKDHRLHSVFQSILYGKSRDYIVNSQLLDQLGWYSSHEYSVLLLQTTYLDEQSKTQTALCDYVETLSPGSLCAFPFQSMIVAFINHTLSQRSFLELQCLVSAFVRDSLLKAAYSRTLVGHFNFYRQYEQALITLQLGQKLTPSRWIYHFNDYSFEYILSNITKQLPAYMIAHEQLLKLKYQDDSQGTDYFETLRSYLNHHLNAVQTANSLFIHRSTLLYRLEKIKSFLKIDFEDPDILLYLMISYRIYDREK